jgi:hypothetical protein
MQLKNLMASFPIFQPTCDGGFRSYHGKGTTGPANGQRTPESEWPVSYTILVLSYSAAFGSTVHPFKNSNSSTRKSANQTVMPSLLTHSTAYEVAS